MIQMQSCREMEINIWKKEDRQKCTNKPVTAVGNGNSILQETLGNCYKTHNIICLVGQGSCAINVLIFIIDILKSAYRSY